MTGRSDQTAGQGADDGARLRPYVPASQHLPELTPLALGLGVVLSLTFGMVNAYLGLKIGLTVSASIPSAVLSMAVLRGLLRRGNDPREQHRAHHRRRAASRWRQA